MKAIVPGDLIGFSAGDLLGAAVNASTLGWPFPPKCWRGLSHVGVVAMDAAGLPVIWEATTLCDLPCLFCGAIHSGLQSHGVQVRIKNYRGAVWHYPLRLGLDGIEQQQVTLYARRYHARGYDYLGAAQSRTLCLGWLRRLFVRQNLDHLFCSEFVAAVWEAAEVWNTPNCSSWSPNRLARIAINVGIVKKPRRLK